MSNFSKKVKYILLISCLCLNIVVVSSNSNTSETITYPQKSAFQPNSDATWLVMIYLDADIDYEWGPMDSIHELESGFVEDSNVEVVFLVDRVDGADQSYGDWTGTRLYRLRHDDDPMTIGSELVADWGEKNMGDNATLREFVTWTTETYTADKSALVLFNHGGALSGICWDWSSYHDHLTLDEVQQAMSGFHVDLLVAEACSMAYLEIAYEWRTFTDYFAASELSVQIEAYDYEAVLRELCENPSMEPWALGELFGQTYYDSMEYSYYKTFSVINCTNLEEVKSEINTLGSKLLNIISENITELSNLRYEMRSDYLARTVDMGNMIDVLKEGFITNTSIVSTLNNLESAYFDCVLFNTTNPNFYSETSGLAMFFPQDNSTIFNWRDYIDSELQGDLTNVDFLEANNWVNFIADYVELAPVLDPLHSPEIHESSLLELDHQYELDLDWNVTDIYFFRSTEAAMYNFTLDIVTGDPAIGLSNLENNHAIITEFPYSSQMNPLLGNKEEISIPLKTGIVIVEISTLTVENEVTLTITKSDPKTITLNQNVTGEFPFAIGIHPPRAVYNNYAIQLELGSYYIDIDIDYPAGLEVFIVSETGYHYLDYQSGIMGEDFSYMLNNTISQTITVYFGSYIGSSKYSFIINSTVEKSSISIFFSIIAIPFIYIIVKKQKSNNDVY